MRRPSFLTVFFTLLAIGFAAVLTLRIRSYQQRADSDGAAAQTAATANAPGSVAPETESISAPLTPEEHARAIEAERQRKLEEALRAPVPASPQSGSTKSVARNPAAPAPVAAQRAPEEKSFVQRVSGAVASLFGGGSAAERPAVTVTPAARPRPEREPTDADSDVRAPQLLAVDFNPPQIRDGESTILSVVATDDLSGVASVTGVISSPSGSVQGFAAQREGESNRYVVRISVPQNAPDGVWRINHLSLADMAKNSLMLVAKQGMLPASASFRVSSDRADSTPPTLRAVWLDQLVMRVGEQNRLYVQAEDDRSGVSAVTGVFVSPTRTARLSFGCVAGQGGTWECAVAPPRCLDCGRWQLEQLQLHDKANNMAVLRLDQPMVSAVQLDITGEQCDSGAPQISAVTVQPGVVSNAEASTVTLLATITDDTCGVASVSGAAVGPTAAGAPRIYFSFMRGSEGQPWTAQITVPMHAVSGVWRIANVQVVDRGQNLKVYNESDAVLSGVVFRVQ